MIVKKSYFTQFCFHLIFWVNKWTGKYLSKKYAKEKKSRDESWKNQFKNSSSFIYSLKKDLKIKLYQDSVLSKLIYEGFEREELAYLVSELKGGDIFVDVGANIGYFSIHASKIVGIEGMVISIEPTPLTFERLIENINLNSLDNIFPMNIGLSNQQGKLQLQVSKSGYDAWNTFANIKGDKYQEEICVKVDTLDNIVASFNKEKIRLVKIDVEGWEKFVLIGGLNFLSIYSPILLIEFTESNTEAAGYPVHEIYDYIEDMGYKWFRIDKGCLIQEPKRSSYPYNNLVAKKIV